MTIRRQLLECLDVPSATAMALAGPSGRLAARWMSTRRLAEPCMRVRTRSNSQGLAWHNGLRTRCLHTTPPSSDGNSTAKSSSHSSSSPQHFPLSTQRQTSYLPHLPRNFGVNQSLSISDSTRQTLEKIVAHFKAVRWAVAYGSGVVSQTGYGEDTKSKPLIDFLLATSHPSHFHSINLAQNPSHYPLLARWLGSDVIAHIQETWGAGVWYATMVEVEGQNIKYGVVSMDSLCEDLLDWKTIYVAGRMHKPVRIIRQDPRVLLANQVNLASVLRVALLSLPEEFSEVQLWEKVAGVSYMGDPRMVIPGGENPRKVQNIVRPQIARFRTLYHKLLAELGEVRAKDSSAAEKLAYGKPRDERMWLRMGLGAEGGSGLILQPNTAEHRAGLLKKLPRNLRKGLESRYSSKLRVSVAHVGEDADPDAGRLSENEFWLKVAEQDSLGKAINEEIRRIIRYPAISQTFKGFVTAGFRKSIRYGSQKVVKWWNAKMSNE